MFGYVKVWLLHPVIGLHMFEELYSQRDLKEMVPVGTKVS